QVYEIHESHGTPIIVMPFISGQDLGKIVRDRQKYKNHKTEKRRSNFAHPWIRLPDKEYLASVLPVLDQMIGGVAALQQAGILHRDIKPGNVLIDERGQAIVADFGLARLQNQGGAPLHGSRLGTQAYAAPEQMLGGEESTTAADIFSVGVSLYQVLTL